MTYSLESTLEQLAKRASRAKVGMAVESSIDRALDVAYGREHERRKPLEVLRDGLHTAHYHDQRPYSSMHSGFKAPLRSCSPFAFSLKDEDPAGWYFHQAQDRVLAVGKVGSPAEFLVVSAPMDADPDLLRQDLLAVRYLDAGKGDRLLGRINPSWGARKSQLTEQALEYRYGLAALPSEIVAKYSLRCI